MTTTLTSTNPATGEALWQGTTTDAAGVHAAVERARAGFSRWSTTPLEERAAILQRFAALASERKEEIARAIASESGKVLREARMEAGALASKVAISLEAYQARTGSSSAAMDGGIQRSLTHRPLGVMAVFGPYNFPVHLANGHIIPALLAGNTVVFKPSEQVPMCGELLVRLYHEAGVPEDVVALVQGARETGVALAQAPGIAGILFTGSYETGRAIHASLAGKPEIMLALEMGGNNPLIIGDVPDAEAAAALVIDSAFATTGQRCTCARRLIVPTGAQGNAVIDAVVALSERLIVGDPFATDPEPYMGPLINNTQAEHVLQAQAALQESGGRVLVASKRLHERLPFLSAGLVDVTAAAREDREVFGPLLQVIRVRDMQEAVEEANRTAFGLSAGLISSDTTQWEYVYPRLRAGIVNYNRPLTGAASAAPFGGPGCSGNFRPSAYYAADYCAYPVASLSSEAVPSLTLPGLRAAS